MKEERIHKIVNGEDYYFCSKCKKWRPKSKFSIDNNSLHQNRGGLCNECKDCQRERYYHERQRLFEDNNLALRYKLQQALKGTRRRSKEKNIYNDLTIDYLLYLWERQKGCCALTGIPMTYKFYEGRVNTNVSVDRIDSTKGYSKDNVQLVCMAANQMKNDLSMEEFIKMCEYVLALERERVKARAAIRNKVAGEK